MTDSAETDVGVEPENRGGTVWDWANQQVVRPGGEGPGVNTPPEKPGTAETDDENGEPTVEEMTKNQLLDYAAEHDIDADIHMTKDEIRQAIADAEA